MSNTTAVPSLSKSQETQSAAPYIVPFAAFIGLLAISPHLTFLGAAQYPAGVAVMAAVILYFSRSVIDLRVRSWPLTLLVGVGVFALWIAPDLLIPGYRSHWLFQNPVTGSLNSSLTEAHRSDWTVLLFRTLRAAAIVPIVEELFWRGWLLRWIQSPRFETIPLGQWTWPAMIITALLFASEHGAYWEVGLATGFIYNWLIVRTKSLGDCIFAHAITNLCLSVFVIASGRWEFWM